MSKNDFPQAHYSRPRPELSLVRLTPQQIREAMTWFNKRQITDFNAAPIPLGLPAPESMAMQTCCTCGPKNRGPAEYISAGIAPTRGRPKRATTILSPSSTPLGASTAAANPFPNAWNSEILLPEATNDGYTPQTAAPIASVSASYPHEYTYPPSDDGQNRMHHQPLLGGSTLFYSSPLIPLPSPLPPLSPLSFSFPPPFNVGDVVDEGGQPRSLSAAQHSPPRLPHENVTPYSSWAQQYIPNLHSIPRTNRKDIAHKTINAEHERTVPDVRKTGVVDYDVVEESSVNLSTPGDATGEADQGWNDQPAPGNELCLAISALDAQKEPAPQVVTAQNAQRSAGNQNQEVPAATSKSITTVAGSRQNLKRRKAFLVYNSCTCGEAVFQPGDDEAKMGVIECQGTGCQTQWFHLACVLLEYPVPGWVCSSCKLQKRRRCGYPEGFHKM